MGLGARPLADQNGYAYVGNDPVDRIDPTGEAFVDCAKILAQLAVASAQPARRIAEQAAGTKDPAVVAGHAKTIAQLQKRVANLAAQAAKQCGDAGKAAAAAAGQATTTCLAVVIIDPCVIDPTFPFCGGL